MDRHYKGMTFEDNRYIHYTSRHWHGYHGLINGRHYAFFAVAKKTMSSVSRNYTWTIWCDGKYIHRIKVFGIQFDSIGSDIGECLTNSFGEAVDKAIAHAESLPCGDKKHWRDNLINEKHYV